jgi:hypothetical protein
MGLEISLLQISAFSFKLPIKFVGSVISNHHSNIDKLSIGIIQVHNYWLIQSS